MRNHKKSSHGFPADEMPVFAVEQGQSGWQVHITWPDGEPGPSIDFVTRSDAEIWIARDAIAWIKRLRQLDRDTH